MDQWETRYDEPEETIGANRQGIEVNTLRIPGDLFALCIGWFSPDVKLVTKKKFSCPKSRQAPIYQTKGSIGTASSRTPGSHTRVQAQRSSIRIAAEFFLFLSGDPPMHRRSVKLDNESDRRRRFPPVPSDQPPSPG